VTVHVSTRGLDKSSRGISPETVRRRGEGLLAALGEPNAELSVLLCGERPMRELNQTYRGRDAVTDVLSFPMREGADQGDELLGDVAICLPQARRQAGRGSSALRDEVVRLLAHGVLHLCNWTHETDRKLGKMQARAAELIAASARPRRS